MAFKGLTGVLCERLKTLIKALIGPYQCGFRPGKSTIDQIFTLHQILEETFETPEDTHHIFVDYIAACDSLIWNRVFDAMSKLDIRSSRYTKSWKKPTNTQVDTHHIFVDYKAACDSPIWNRVFDEMSELDIPAKLTRLC